MKFWFPAFLVLFEFSTYVSNDMIMPGMPHVVHDFHVEIGAASFALSAALQDVDAALAVELEEQVLHVPTALH